MWRHVWLDLPILVLKLYFFISKNKCVFCEVELIRKYHLSIIISCCDGLRTQNTQLHAPVCVYTWRRGKKSLLQWKICCLWACIRFSRIEDNFHVRLWTFKSHYFFGVNVKPGCAIAQTVSHSWGQNSISELFIKDLWWARWPRDRFFKSISVTGSQLF